MTAVLVGDLNLAILNPITAAALIPAGAQLSGNLTAALALQASVSLGAPSLSVQLQALLDVTIPNLQAGISLGLPGITFSVAAAAQLVAAAQLALGNLQILITLLGGSVFVYSYSGGTVSTIGSDLAAAISGTPPPGLLPGDAVSGILLGAAPASWTVSSPYFGGL